MVEGAIVRFGRSRISYAGIVSFAIHFKSAARYMAQSGKPLWQMTLSAASVGARRTMIRAKSNG